MATVSVCLKIKRKWRESHQHSKKNRKMLFAGKTYLPLPKKDDRHWEEARKLCQAIMAGKRIVKDAGLSDAVDRR